MDPICDVFYHIKYMFTGDSIKTDVEGIIRSLRPALQKRLRFITHLNLDSIEVCGLDVYFFIFYFFSPCLRLDCAVVVDCFWFFGILSLW